MTRRLILALVLLVAGASGAVADRVFTRTYYAVTLADVNSQCFVRKATSPTGWQSVANVGVRASDGQGYTAFYTADATAGQRTQIETFITNTVLTPLNAQEGL